MLKSNNAKFPYAKEQRIRFFEFLIARYGHIKSTTLMGFFGISHSTAMRDIAAYKELKPDNCLFDPNSRTYYKTEKFESYWD